MTARKVRTFSRTRHLRRIARSGGLSRTKKHGNPGTPKGRRCGGINSIETHIRLKTGFKTLHPLPLIELSDDLAEFLGIVMGDGHLSEYQVLIVTNARTDYAHALFIKNLANDLFSPLRMRVHRHTKDNGVSLVISSKSLVNAFTALGMPKGNKIWNRLEVPGWVLSSPSYRKAFLRGVFDTDGCVYLDTHHRTAGTYRYLGWTITSYAGTFLAGLEKILLSFGFSPTHRESQKSVFLRRQDEIHRFFAEIGSSNQKNLRRYRTFCRLAKKGRVPKRS